MIRLPDVSWLGRLVTCAAVLAAATPATAQVSIVIDKSTQRMLVAVDGVAEYYWKVSTGRFGGGTPIGAFTPQRMHKSWYSRKYDWAPMPHAIFYDDAYAIHGTTWLSRLGQPASHGCVRLHPDHAKTLFGLVRQAGMDKTTIAIVGTNPPPAPPAVASAQSRRMAERRSWARRHFASPFVENVAQW